MSAETPPRGHRHSRSAAMPMTSASSQNPQNPHHLNQQAHIQNSQTETKINQPAAASQSTTPPRTPRRGNKPSTQSSNTNAPDSGSKQKSRSKNRPKNVNTSPAAMRNGRNTPPLTGAQSAGMPSSAKPISTPSTTAYAGPTFHASPAPSALPIPSFYSKSVPDSPEARGVKAVKGPQLKKDTPQPNNLFTSPAANNPFQREESPLDFFFRADREEKARARSASSTQTTLAATGPFQPPLESPRSSQTPPALPTHSRPRQGHSSRMSANGMFAMELDGEPDAGTVYGPAFSTPYADRIHAARASSQPLKSTGQSFHDPQQSIDRSEALKAYLFSGHPLPSPNEPMSGGVGPAHTPNPNSVRTYQQTSTHASALRSGLSPRPHSNIHPQDNSHHVTRPSGRSSGLRQEVTPTKTPTRTPDRNGTYAQTPVSTGFVGTLVPQTQSADPNSTTYLIPENKAADLRGMEDSLRRILKLDSARSSAVVSGSLPSASGSVPNYVGGRPPANGMHNGVMGS